MNRGVRAGGVLSDLTIHKNVCFSCNFNFLKYAHHFLPTRESYTSLKFSLKRGTTAKQGHFTEGVISKQLAAQLHIISLGFMNPEWQYCDLTACNYLTPICYKQTLDCSLIMYASA